jgi:hypothetical protein
MSAVDRDPFFRRFFARVSPEVASTFDDEQLSAIKRAFGARTPGAHTVDLRFSVPFFGGRSFYVVFLVGRERRSGRRRLWERRLRPLATIANALAVTFFALMFGTALLSLLYVGKRAMHLDLVPGVNMVPDRQVERMLR